MRNDVDLFLWDKIWINRRVSLVEKENTVYDLENEIHFPNVWGSKSGPKQYFVIVF